MISKAESNESMENSDMKSHISGSLNNLVPVVLQEMKNNSKDKEYYIEFLNDNDILDYQINIFNFIAQNNDIDLIDCCLKANITFLRDHFGNTPLTYYLLNKTQEGVDKILKSVSEDLK